MAVEELALVKISIIVPAFNEEKLIEASLRAIHNSTEALRALGWGVELIVCDNNSKDRTAEIARSCGAVVVFEPINQIARARNRGASAASGDWFVFVDADSRPNLALFLDVAEQIQSGKCLAGGSTIRLDEEHFWAGLITAGWNCLSRTLKWAAGSFIFCDADAFREVGGFNNELFVSEELDLFRRLHRAARHHNKSIVILNEHPLETSARKIHLYSAGEHLLFLLRAVVLPRQTMKDRSACIPWYDGRR